MKNNLANDPSPYLQQHKDNPVHWQTWCAETLLLAKTKKKPIILSIGYASCHWCHVMAHESFEDNDTAELMNKHFINIKVDREERPDIDFVFQSAYQLFNQSGGGWPLTIFLDENGVPFIAGTYFPIISKNGMPSFKEILNKVNAAYQEQRDKIILQKDLIKSSLNLKKNSVVNQDLESILDSIISNLDKENGGYKGAPKFPTFNIFDTFLYFYNKTKKNKFIEPVKLFLKKLCAQGIYDQTEGGISRYTVDENWLIPHFEKMLYDNAQFVSLLSKYSKINSDEYFKNKIIQTISFFNSNFIKDNLLGTAYDADSEGEEGKYYIYTFDEIKHIKDVEKYFDVTPEGNWEGKIILKEIGIAPKSIIQELNIIRKKKTKPFFDDKIQLDLNCLWVSSLINAHSVLANKGYLEQAEKLFNQIEKRFMTQDLYHCNFKNVVFLEDYAYIINCLIDLFDATLNIKYKLKATDLTKLAVNKFYIKEKNIFQKNIFNKNDLFYDPIDISDNSIPNGNSIMLLNFARLGFIDEAKKLAQSLNGYLNVYKSFMTSSIKSIDYFNQIAGRKNCNHEGCPT
ncbi:thioredoxin domain-containing protein [Pelagibacteraceae bacterium]|nr:thioredoxin domain-containing protein [Pelagibacteraceae bacterium]